MDIVRDWGFILDGFSRLVGVLGDENLLRGEIGFLWISVLIC